MAKILKEGEVEQIIKVLHNDKTIDRIVSRRENLLARLNERKKRADAIIVATNKLLENGIGEFHLQDFFKKKENGGWYLSIDQELCTKQYLSTDTLYYSYRGYRGDTDIGYFTTVSTVKKGFLTCGYRNILTNDQMEKMIEAFDIFEDCFFAKVKQLLAEES